jgi:hypothetical protein
MVVTVRTSSTSLPEDERSRLARVLGLALTQLGYAGEHGARGLVEAAGALGTRLWEGT